MTKVFSKADLLAHHSEAENYPFKELNGGELPLRRLTDPQWSAIEELQSTGVKMTGAPEFDEDGNARPGANTGMEVDIQAQARAAGAARRKVVMWGLAFQDENGKYVPMSKNDVDEIRDPGLIAAIYNKVLEISGVGEEAGKNAERFRPDREGRGDSDAASAGDEAGGEPAGSDTSSDGVPSDSSSEGEGPDGGGQEGGSGPAHAAAGPDEYAA